MPVVVEAGARELHGERQADVAEADDADACGAVRSSRDLSREASIRRHVHSESSRTGSGACRASVVLDAAPEAGAAFGLIRSERRRLRRTRAAHRPCRGCRRRRTPAPQPAATRPLAGAAGCAALAQQPVLLGEHAALFGELALALAMSCSRCCSCRSRAPPAARRRWSSSARCARSAPAASPRPPAAGLRAARIRRHDRRRGGSRSTADRARRSRRARR